MPKVAKPEVSYVKAGNSDSLTANVISTLVFLSYHMHVLE